MKTYTLTIIPSISFILGSKATILWRNVSDAYVNKTKRRLFMLTRAYKCDASCSTNSNRNASTIYQHSNELTKMADRTDARNCQNILRLGRPWIFYFCFITQFVTQQWLSPSYSDTIWLNIEHTHLHGFYILQCGQRHHCMSGCLRNYETDFTGKTEGGGELEKRRFFF